MNVSTKKAAILTTKECEETIDDTTTTTQNKTIVIKELVENCKPFVASSVLFLSVSVIATGLFIHFYCKSKKQCFTILTNILKTISCVKYQSLFYFF